MIKPMLVLLKFIKYFSLFIMIFILSYPLNAATDKPEAKIFKTPELTSLSNDELLKQTLNIINESSEKTFARLRALDKSEILLSRARQTAKFPDIPKKEIKIKFANKISSVEIAKIKLEHAKTRLNALKAYLEMTQTEKILSDEYIKQLDNALSAVQSLINTIDSLHLNMLEIRLRIKDGTLAYAKIPDALNEQKLKVLLHNLKIRQIKLRKKTEKANKTLKTIISRIEQVKKEVIEAEAGMSTAEEKYSRELKRDTLEKEFSAQTQEQLINRIKESEQEMVLFNKAFNLSHTRLLKIKEESDKIRKEIEEHKKPETQDYTMPHAYIRAEETDQAIKKVQEVSDYYRVHIKNIEELYSVLLSLIKQGDIFLIDVKVMLEHIFKIQVLVKKLEDKNIQDVKKISETLTDQFLIDSSDNALKLRTESIAIVQKAGDELEKLLDTKEELQKEELDMRGVLIRLQETRRNALKIREWTLELEKLSLEQLIVRFNELSEQMDKKTNKLDRIRKETEKGELAVEENRKKIDALKDPLLRIAQQESLEEKYNILKMLHQIANLEFKSEKNKSLNQTKNILALKQDDTPETSLSEEWQNLLYTRSGVVAEKQKLRNNLLETLTNLDNKYNEYENILTETRKLSMHIQAAALELKKQAGKKKINKQNIADRINQALNQSLITQIEKESAELMNKQVLVKQEIEVLTKPDKNLEKSQALLTQALNSIIKRLDFMKELKKLQQNYERRHDQLSEIEHKQLEHATIRRMEFENTAKEFFLNLFVPSKSAENLTELLKIYYRDVIEQEFRQANIEKQKQILKNLIELANSEKMAVEEILPLLQKEAQESKLRKEKVWIKIRARLMPKKAEKIIANFKSRTGQTFSVPPPVPDEMKTEFVVKAVNPIFESHIEQVAAEKWIDVFTQRISESGIQSEVIKYQDMNGVLDAEELGIQRKLNLLIGQPRSELENLSPDEKPDTKEDLKRFLKGEIGILRADRYKIWIQKTFEVIVKLTSILLAAIFLNWLTNFLTDRFYKSDGKSKDTKSSVFADILPLLKTFFKFLIWNVAIMAILSSLGFNVGAILAGFGIGGLAIAMAAKETISNILGGITIFFSKPFKVGDLVKIKGHKEAIVREIGIRSTKIEDFLYNTVYTVPNMIFSDSIIENISSWPGKFIYQELRIDIDTTPRQMELAIKLIKEIILGSDKINKLDRVIFKEFDEYSYVIYYVYNVTEFKNRHIVRGEINMEILKKFNENNIKMARLPLSSLEALPEQ